MSGGWSGFGEFIIFAGLCSILSSLCVFIGVWFSTACQLPIRWVGTATYLIPWASAAVGGLCSMHMHRYLIVCLSVMAVCGFGAGYIYLVVAQIVNQSKTPTCIRSWAKDVVWLGLAVSLLVVCSPLVLIVKDQCKNINWGLSRRSKLKSLVEKTLKLYDPQVNLQKEIELDPRYVDFIQFLRFERLSNEEIDRIISLENIALDETSTLQDCCVCHSKIDGLRGYLILPECNHHFDIACFEKHCRGNAVTCAACNNHIRRAILYKIHNIQVGNDDAHIF